MKILHITASYKPAYVYGGPIVSISRLCEELSNGQQVITVYTTNANGEQELDVPTQQALQVFGVTVYYFERLTRGHSHFSPSLLLMLWQNVNKYEIIHIHSWWNLVSVLSAFICLLKGVKPILSPRGTFSPYSFTKGKSRAKKWLHILFGKRLLKNTYIHATTQKEWEECQALIPGWKGFVLPNYLPTEMECLLKKPIVSDPEKETKEAFQLLFVGRLHPVKGIELLLEALATLNFPFKLTLVGEGEEAYEKGLKAKAEKLGIVPHLYWRGFLQGEEKLVVYQKADILILPSYTENFGMVLIEAWATGLPTIVTEGVGLSDFVQTHKLGWVVKHTSESIAHAILTAQQEETTRLSIAKNAHKIASQEFSTEILTEKYLSAYQQFKIS
ncbi:XrtY-associated glycosyltransferase XYAG1 [Algoriphagus formosus]|uniref:XrtY-associated glycosyltransferase XYAG1 n=1 Tax=Algoriphagus formosus TaxID=2007308 RepID=UPI003F72E85A